MLLCRDLPWCGVCAQTSSKQSIPWWAGWLLWPTSYYVTLDIYFSFWEAPSGECYRYKVGGHSVCKLCHWSSCVHWYFPSASHLFPLDFQITSLFLMAVSYQIWHTWESTFLWIEKKEDTTRELSSLICFLQTMKSPGHCSPNRHPLPVKDLGCGIQITRAKYKG